VDDTIGTIGDAVPGLPDDAVGTVGDTVGDVTDTVGNSLSDLLEALQSTSLLDVDVDLDAALDLAAPISAAIAANANLALPIDAAVTANILSPNAVALATADQTALLQQTLDADAIASSEQDSAISQGETSPGGDAAESATPVPADSTGGPAATAGDLLGGTSLLSIAADLDLDLDLAAPIGAALAANLNVAAPIDAAVSANILSPGAISMATADQDAAIVQTLEGVANATSDQSSTIEQGEVAESDATP
jgi:hypothetical protein